MTICMKHPAGFSLIIRECQPGGIARAYKRNGMGKETLLNVYGSVQLALANVQEEYDLEINIKAILTTLYIEM